MQVLYAGIFVALNYLTFVSRTISLKSRWSLLYFHVLVRLAAQGCGIAFGITGFSNTDLLIAFLVLCAASSVTSLTLMQAQRRGRLCVTIIGN